MPAIKELIKLSGESAFRVLKWERNLREVFWLGGPGRLTRIDGEGAHWHYHQALELTLFVEGKGTRFVGDRIQSFEAGEIVLLGENLPHCWHTMGASAGLSVQFSFAPANPVWAFPEFAGLARFIKTAGKGIHYRGKSAAVLTDKLQRLAAADGLERLGRLFELLSIAAGAPKFEQEFISNQTFSLSSDSDQQNAMRAAMRFMLTNYKDKIGLQPLLEATRMSKPTFSRYFKKHSGKSFGKMLQQIRVEAACRELRETNKSVTEIALGCGFCHMSFFNRVFSRTMRCTPTRYRERQRY